MSTLARVNPSGQPQPVPFANKIVMRLLDSPLHLFIGGNLAVLRYRARGGARVVLPVQAARDAGTVVLMAGNAASKQWWRHFRKGAPVEVLIGGDWITGTGRVVTGSVGSAAALYQKTFPRLDIPAETTFVVVTLDIGTPPPALRGSQLMSAWFWIVTAAEFAGFAVPACVGALTANTRPAIAIPALLAAGAVEGAMLGWGQVSVLRRALAGIPRRRWVAATAAAAALAYGIGLIPSTFHESIGSLPAAIMVPGAVVLGATLLTSIGAAQWLILRDHIAGAAWWIVATALAWMVGLGVFLGFAMPLWQPGQAVAQTVLIGVGGGLLMAAITSAITGAALRRLVR